MSADHGSGGSGRGYREMARHLGGFGVSGALAFAADAGVLWLLTVHAGIGPLAARVVSIAVAMVVSWQSHRRLTFRVAAPPTLAEFGRFALSSLTATAASYTVYAAVLLTRPGTSPLIALLISAIIGMVVSYAGLRLAVFGKPGRGPRD